MSLRAQRSNLIGFLLGLFLLISPNLFACPSGQSCPAGMDCVSSPSLCVADTSSSSTTSSSSSSEPTTAKDQLGLTFNTTNDGINAPTFLQGSSCTTCVRFEPITAGVKTNTLTVTAGSAGSAAATSAITGTGTGTNFSITNDSANAPTLMTGSSCTTCVKFDPQNASVPQPIEK